MHFAERIRNGEAPPWSHRVAWVDYCRRERVCWPLGVHLLARFVRWAWIQSFRWRPDVWDRKCMEIDLKYRKILERKDDSLRLAMLTIADLTPFNDGDMANYADRMRDNLRASLIAPDHPGFAGGIE